MAEERQAEAERIGALVVGLRLSRGWSQEALAHEAGVSVSTVSRLERGALKGDARKVAKIAQALDVPAAVLRPRAPDVETQLDKIEKALSELEEQVRLMRAETAARDAEVLKRLDEGLPPTRRSPPPPPR